MEQIRDLTLINDDEKYNYANILSMKLSKDSSMKPSYFRNSMFDQSRTIQFLHSV